MGRGEEPALAVDSAGGQGKAQRKLCPLPAVAKLWGALGSGPSSALFMLCSIPIPRLSLLVREMGKLVPMPPGALRPCLGLHLPICRVGGQPWLVSVQGTGLLTASSAVPGAARGPLCAGAGGVLGPGPLPTRAPSLAP